MGGKWRGKNHNVIVFNFVLNVCSYLSTLNIMIIEYSVIKLGSAPLGVPRVYFRRMAENVKRQLKRSS